MSSSSTGPIPSRSKAIIVANVCMLSLATIILAARQMIRIFIRRTSLEADDYLIGLAWLFSLAYTVDVCTQTGFGLGKHITDLPPTTNFSVSFELFYFGEMLYVLTVGATKASILCLYLKLSPHRTFRFAIWSMMFFVVGSVVASMFAIIFQCIPIHKAWDTDVPGHCVDKVAVFLSNAGMDIAQDVLTYFLPVPMLWKLHLPRRQRIALILVFMVGGFVVITGIIRLSSLKVAADSVDPTWNNFHSAIWSSVESNIGIVCASLVHFKAAFVRYAPRLLGIQGRTDSGKPIPDSDSRGLVTFGQSTKKTKRGILTELELEESASRTEILRSSA